MDLSAPSVVRTRTPRWPAVVIVVVVLVAAVLLGAQRVDDGQVRLLSAVAGYVLGALVATALASVYRARRNTARLSNEFRPSRGLDRLVSTTLVVGLLVGLVQAFLLATELAK